MKTGKNMKKYSVIIAVVAASVLSFTAQAGPITQLQGSIGFGGGTYTANGTGLSQLYGATAITSITGEKVTAPSTGNFAALVGDAAAFTVTQGPPANPFPLAVESFSSLNGGLGFLLFSVTDGSGDTWNFFTTSTTLSNPISTSGGTTTNIWVLSGNGAATETNSVGVEIGQALGGTWTLQASASGNSLTFQGNGALPDGGTTVALLGGALVGLQVFRRKLFR